MTRVLPSSEDEPATQKFLRGARARRALLLRRAANRASGRILLSIGAEARRPLAMQAPQAPAALEFPVSDHPERAPLGRPVQPAAALEDERNRWDGRL